MKIKKTKKVSYDSGPNMTPLVDVVMVILIFLMMVGNFGGLEHYLLSNVPLIGEGTTQGRKDLDDIKDTVEISVKSTADGFQAGIVGSSVKIDAGSLDDALRQLKARYDAMGRGPDKIQVIIAPQRTVKYMHLVKVYEAALRAKYTKIAFRGL